MTSNLNKRKGYMNKDLGFRFEVIYKDIHLLEVRISAWNGAFSGVADVYVGLDQLQETAAKLRGFPTDPSDVREANFGAFGPKSVPGRRVSMRFYCADRSGHSYVDSTIESDYNAAGKIETVSLSLAIEAAAMDSFLEELHRSGANSAGVAFLKGAVPITI
jgi:hypothetical protein